jgi:hypothetical protein
MIFPSGFGKASSGATSPTERPTDCNFCLYDKKASEAKDRNAVKKRTLIFFTFKFIFTNV